MSDARGIVGPMTDTLEIVLAGETRRVRGEELDGQYSQLAGRDLRRFRAEFAVEDESLHARVLEDLASGRDQDPLVGEAGALWRVGTHSHWNEGGSGKHHHTVTFEEVPQPRRADRVQLPGLSITPDDYREEQREGDPLVVQFLCTLDDSAAQTLDTLIAQHRPDGEYFDVLLEGIESSPRRMRFGRCLFESLPAGRRDYVVLVGEEDDEDGPSFVLDEPHRSRLTDLALKNAAQIEALIAELVATGGLDEAAAARIAAAGVAAGDDPRAWRQFQRAQSIDDFWRR